MCNAYVTYFSNAHLDCFNLCKSVDDNFDNSVQSDPLSWFHKLIDKYSDIKPYMSFTITDESCCLACGEVIKNDRICQSFGLQLLPPQKCKASCKMQDIIDYNFKQPKSCSTFKCPRCNFTNGQQWTRIGQSSNFIVLSLDVFCYENNDDSNKGNGKIMKNKSVLIKEAQTDLIEIAGKIWRLKNMIIHEGSQPDKGIYKTYIRHTIDKRDTWTEVLNDRVLKKKWPVGAKGAYIMIFEPSVDQNSRGIMLRNIMKGISCPGRKGGAFNEMSIDKYNKDNILDRYTLIRGFSNAEYGSFALVIIQSLFHINAVAVNITKLFSSETLFYNLFKDYFDNSSMNPMPLLQSVHSKFENYDDHSAMDWFKHLLINYPTFNNIINIDLTEHYKCKSDYCTHEGVQTISMPILQLQLPTLQGKGHIKTNLQQLIDDNLNRKNTSETVCPECGTLTLEKFSRIEHLNHLIVISLGTYDELCNFKSMHADNLFISGLNTTDICILDKWWRPKCVVFF